MLERYLDLASIKSDADEFIFRSLSYCKNVDSYKLRNADRPLSYTRAREIILSAFDSIGLESSKSGIHSLRSGGATAAANVAGHTGTAASGTADAMLFFLS